MKISKALAKKHTEALRLVRAGRPLTLDEREFVLEHFHEGAEHMNALAGAFFTPLGLARDLAIETTGSKKILDLCAGIGRLASACERDDVELTCVELNPAYVEAGRAALPNARWIQASAFDLGAYMKFGPFDTVISNPPFGKTGSDAAEHIGKYTGGLFEFKVIETALLTGAAYGVFVVPQQSAPFRYSGVPCFKPCEEEHVRKFREQTGILMEPNCGIDTTCYRADWRGTSPVCEIVLCDFETSPAST